MAKPGKYRRFFIILFELFIVLLLFQAWREYTGLEVGSFLVLIFVLLWLLNWLISRMQFGKSMRETILYKLTPHFRFESDWFGILVAAGIILGFALSQSIGNGWATFLIILFMLFVAWKLTYRKRNILKRSWGLVALAFVLGMLFGTGITNTLVMVIIFLAGNLVMYVSSQPNEY